MKTIDRERFLEESMNILGQIHNQLSSLPALKITELEPECTALVVVDMINGFVREGSLKSEYAEKLIPEISKLMKLCSARGIPIIAFADTHTQAAPEVDAYPVHCLAGSSESEVVDELKASAEFKLISKNSTNGFIEPEFQDWLSNNPGIDGFIVVGVCTDICVQQFAVTLKTWFNRQDRKSRVIVPLNAVDTFDLGPHNRYLMNCMALYGMLGNGVEVIKRIEDD